MVRRPELEDPELESLPEEVVGWVQAEVEVALEDQLSAVVLSDQSSEDEVTFQRCQYGGQRQKWNGPKGKLRTWGAQACSLLKVAATGVAAAT